MRQIFRTLPWIHPSEPEVLQTLYRKYGRKIHVKKGETLKSGGEAPVLFFLEKGLAAYWVNRTTPGHTAILSLIIPGRTMGDITCFSGERVNVTSRTLQDSDVRVVKRCDLLAEYLRNPQLLLTESQQLIRKQESHIEGMTANFTLGAEARVKLFLRVLLAAYGLPLHEGDNVIPLLISNELIGDVVNLSRMSVYRILTDWEKAGLAKRNGKNLTVASRLFHDVYDWDDHHYTERDLEGYGPRSVFD